MAGNGRILTKDLDARLKAVEEQLGQISERISQLVGAMPAPSNGALATNGTAEPENHGGKIAELEARVTTLDERVQKITSTIVQQASRWA